MRKFCVPVTLLSLAACAPALAPKAVAVNDVALAELKRSDGSDAGVATISDRSDEVWLEVAAIKITPGTYGIHLHSIGKCEAPDFTSAGPHWNPAQKQHGFDNPMGTHAGDIPNLVVNSGGVGALEIELPNTTFEGANGALDADGIALVIHEKADDYATDPSGNSGKRLICGVFTKP
jgi:superoxide dismutase, Cu-Zn family